MSLFKNFRFRTRIILVCIVILLLNSIACGSIYYNYVFKDTLKNYYSSSEDMVSQMRMHLTNEIFDRIPFFDEEIKNRFADKILEYAANEAKKYPTQMQDLIVCRSAELFIGNTAAIMTMDILYGNGTFRPLNEKEKVTANLLMFSDRLPE